VNILLGVHQFFPHHYSGTERYALNLARQLLSMGHGVRVLTYDLKHEARELAPGGRLFMREYSYQGIPVTAFSHPEPLDFRFDLCNEAFAEETRHLLRREAFDIYHCAHPLFIGGSLKAARAARIPTVLMLTDYWLLCPLSILLRVDNTLCEGPDGGRNCLRYCFNGMTQADFDRRIEQALELFACADAVLAPSLFLNGAFRFNRFPGAHRIALSRHGFDYSGIAKKTARALNPDRITLGYIGTLQFHKGVHVLVEAFRKVSSPQLRLEIWGGCFHEIEYEAHIKRLAEGDSRIRFRGIYDHEELPQIMESIDVVVVPSVWYENAPLTISSSHAFGIPVIASDVGGMSEMVVDGENGLTFRAGDPDSLAEQLERVASSPLLLTRLQEGIVPPPRLEEEAFWMERLYRSLLAARELAA
jgi:glycosyltransferase involved in cell wall biosynthesis